MAARFYGHEYDDDNRRLTLKPLFLLGDGLMIKLSKNLEKELAAHRFYYGLYMSLMPDSNVLYVPRVYGGFRGASAAALLPAKENPEVVIPPEYQTWLAAKPERGCIIMDSMTLLTAEDWEYLDFRAEKVMLQTVVDPPRSIVQADEVIKRLFPLITFNPFWHLPCQDQPSALEYLPEKGYEEELQPLAYNPMHIYVRDLDWLGFSAMELADEMADLFAEAVFGRKQWDFYGVKIVMTNEGAALINFENCCDLRHRKSDDELATAADRSLIRLFKVDKSSAQ